MEYVRLPSHAHTSLDIHTYVHTYTHTNMFTSTRVKFGPVQCGKGRREGKIHSVATEEIWNHLQREEPHTINHLCIAGTI